MSEYIFREVFLSLTNEKDARVHKTGIYQGFSLLFCLDILMKMVGRKLDSRICGYWRA